MAEPTPEWKLDAFSWLPLEQWTPVSILCDYEIKGRRYCKVCDKWIVPKRNLSHVKYHIKEVQFITKIRKKQAAEAAAEARKFRAAEKKLEKEAMKLLGKE